MVIGFMPNGLLPNEATSVNLVLDQDRWSLVEERSAELIAHIQPNQQSEEHRNAVASYVKRLIVKCFSCEVFTFGSVPLKTYLPDGDIDLTAFSSNHNVKDCWAFKVRDILENEGKSEDAEFHVKEVQCIQAEVKIVKCLVENIVVDISFNQLGGLCTLCFLEEFDDLTRRNHIFKRSIILIKAWCYYESRILGASHGLISTYALETLVLYIFNVYNNTLGGPLEVLYRFLEFFSKFDWDNYCLSLWGPVPISSLPNMRAEPPLKDCKVLLLDKSVLDACITKYGVMPSSQEIQEQPFVSKYLNIIDPLRANNNLGRSISKGSFFRIRKAFALGAQQLLSLLDCPEENSIAEFDLLFKNTWGRVWKGYRPDAPSYDLYARNKNVIENSTCHEPADEHAEASNASHYTYQMYGNHLIEAKPMFGTTCLSAISQTPSPKTNGILTSTLMKNALTGKGQSTIYSLHDVHGVHHFDRVHSRPEFAHLSGEVPSRHGDIGVSEMENMQSCSRPKVLANHDDSVSAESQQQASYDWRIDDAADSKNDSSSYNTEFGLDVIKENGCSIGKAMNMHKKGQDFLNLTESYGNRRSGGYLQAPVNVNSSNVPFLVPSPVLASGYTHANSFAMLPLDVPSFESFWSQNLPCSEHLMPLPALQWFPTLGAMLNQEEVNEPVDDNVVLAHLDHDHSDGGLWSEENINSVGRYNYEDWNIQDPEQSECSSSGNSSSLTNSGNYMLEDCGPTTGQRLLTSKTCGDDLLDERNLDGYVNSTTRSGCFLASCSTSSSELSSSTSSNMFPSKASKLNTDQRKLAFPSTPSTVSERIHEGKHHDHTSSWSDDASGERICQSTVGTDLSECTTAGAVTSDVQDHRFASFKQGKTSMSKSSIPNFPVLVGPGSSQRAVDNHRSLPFACHPTGSPVTYSTMLPLYNIPPESSSASNYMDMDAELVNLHACQLNGSLGSAVGNKQLDTFHKPNNNINDATSVSFPKQRSDILHGDFKSYWLNLQYGRFCQNAQLQGPLSYPPFVVPPMYAQGQFPWDGSGRPSSNMNIMAHGHPFVPLMPMQCGLDSCVRTNQLYADDLPRYTGGTGTYLPNPESYKKYYWRMHSNNRNQRVNYNFDRKDHPSEREWNWNFHSKPRFANRDQFYYPVEEPGIRMDKSNLSNRRPVKSWNSFKQGSFYKGKSYYGSSITSMPNNHVAADMPYGNHRPPISSTNLSGTNETTQ